MEIATSWMEEGIEQGLEQELEQGRQSQLRLVGKLLTKKFGQLPAMLQHQIEGLTFLQVEQLGEQLLDSQTIRTLGNWLTQLEASEGFTGEKAEMFNQLRQQVGAIAPKQKQKLLALSTEQWRNLSTIDFESINDLDSWLSSTSTESD
ncbi:MAG: DUF4351 domain-containing protein [Phormidesmis sp.]